MRLQSGFISLLLALSCVECIDARQILRIRQDNTDAATSTSNEPAASSHSPASTPTPTSTGTSTGNGASTSVPASQVTDATSPLTLASTISDILPSTTSTPLPSNGTSSDDGVVLPIQPEINPALAIAGVILMIAGLALGFVGIKHKATQTFISTALLVALGIEVLVIYLMHPPVPAAIQGAYLVAGVAGGSLLGGLSLVFKEVCEGFGCLLGGFCFAMWLLVLSPGGLIPNSAGKIILIAVLCVAGYCSYISRFTRAYGVIFCTAFAGSTAFILGIDCFSKAGLKEFWLYIWDLNDNEFPLFTSTYPITRNMRAEIAAIVIVAFLGVMSQIKIWKIVREQKAKRDAQRIQDEEARDALEEEVGRDVENRNRKSLANWEGNYDDKKQPSVYVDSGTASVDEDDCSRDEGTKKGNSYPMVSVSRASKDGGSADSKRQSSASVRRSRSSFAPSLPPLEFGEENAGADAKEPSIATEKRSIETRASVFISTTPTTEQPPTPGLNMPEPSVKDRRGINIKRLSIKSLRTKESLEQAQSPQSPWVEEEEEDDVASSIAATAADAPDMDALSVRLSRPNSMYFSFAAPPTPGAKSRESFIEDDDEEALIPQVPAIPAALRASGSRASLAVPKSPVTPGVPPSPRSRKSGESTEKPELAGRLPKKLSKAASKYLTNEWAKAVSSAEPEPFEELPDHDPDAVQVEMGDAAEFARAKTNNAAPRPPTPPPAPEPEREPEPPKTEPPPKSEKRRSLKQIAKRMSSAALTPIYAHDKSTEDDWSVPLARRVSSNPALSLQPAPAPVEGQRNVSAPILEQPVVDSPMDVSPPVIREQRSSSRMDIAAPMLKEQRSSSRLDTATPVLKEQRSSSRLDTATPVLKEQRSSSRMAITKRGSQSNLLDERKDRIENRLTTTSFMAPNPATSEGSGGGRNDSRQGSLTDTPERKLSATPTPTLPIDEEDMTLAERKALVQQQQQQQAIALQQQSPIDRPPTATLVRQLSTTQQLTSPPRAANKPVRMSSTNFNPPIYDSHQPKRTSSHNATKQAVNWSTWRSSSAMSNHQRNPFTTAETQMEMLRHARMQTENEKRERERERTERQEQIDGFMRMGGMNGAHRAALSRMQAGVKKEGGP